MSYRAITVTTNPTVIASYNPRRISLTIVNVGNNDVYISIDPQNIVANGFPLSPGMILTLVREDGDKAEYAFYAQTLTGTAELRIQEGVV
jgi:hypothetical protein